ncbi:hypothetical protein [Actinoallomurus rhizosphaericola]|uniref:hypothetical protein n=1 Tax=Actinoallomurus rhizosphaericola TaxID=2952536 RepID=UPI0020930A6E|nr:hypothetical protein [Actinoallomurus rhizosphaericola]MCO5998742.1 hypothetical protein [Actinoallomurus rhizosphaericola]
MMRVFVGAGVVGLLSGGLVVAAGGSAMAKSDLDLRAARNVIQRGQTVHLAGFAGDDAGLRESRFCLQVRDAGHWSQVGECVTPYRVDGWTADFGFSTRLLSRGKYSFRAVGMSVRHKKHKAHEIYGPSPTVRVTVR